MAPRVTQMFGIKFIKTGPTQYVIHYQNGRIKRSGTGMSFFYHEPSSSIVVIPVGTADIPFIFKETTGDFQTVTVQGQITYRIEDPQTIASCLDFTMLEGRYHSDDPEKLSQRLINLAQVKVRSHIGKHTLQENLQAAELISSGVTAALTSSESLTQTGIEMIFFTVLSIKPSPEMARALEAEARESIHRESDEAIYKRRNASVENERKIKESELSTEVAVEEKKRQIRETRANTDLALQAKQQELKQATLKGEIELEMDRQNLVNAKVENVRVEADVQAYGVEASLRPLRALEPEVLQALTLQSAEPRLMATLALKELASNANKIGHLHLAPDLIETLMRNDP